jgi:DNA-binding MarR family transcriptional regulator
MVQSPMSTAKLKKEVVKNLQAKPLSLAEIAAAMELKEKKVFRLLRSLFEGGEIVSLRGPDGIRKYRLTTDEEKAVTKKANEEKAAAKEGEEVDVDEEDEEDE